MTDDPNETTVPSPAYQSLQLANVSAALKSVAHPLLRAIVTMYEKTDRPEEAAKYRQKLEQINPTTTPTTRLYR